MNLYRTENIDTPNVYNTCKYCKETEFGSPASEAIVCLGSELFQSWVEVDQRIFPGGIMELYIGIGGTDIICERTRINFCPMCGRKLESEDTTDE